MSYDKTNHAIISRINPKINPTLKQGLVFSSGGAGCLNYGALPLIYTSTTKMRWQFRLNTVAGAGTARNILSQYNTAESKRSWDWNINTLNRFSVLIGAKGGGSSSVNASPQDGSRNYYSPQSGDIIDVKWESGIITVLVNNTTTYTYNASATQKVIYNNNAPNLNVGGYISGTTGSYNGSMCCVKIWVDNILDTDTPKFYAPCGDKTGRDIISGTKPTVVGTVDMTVASDTASFRAEEYGFAVKSGEIFLKNYSGTGYAGLVGAPDAVYQGLIATKGSIEIAAFNLLGTLIDFGNSTAVKATGLRLAEFDGTDCNDELIYVAEPKLDIAEIAILVPSTDDNVELDKNFTVSGTSNCANVKIEASADGTTWVTLSASTAVSSGAFSKADCQLPSASFDVNDAITIRVSDVDSVSLPDTVSINTIATITINEITDVTAGVAKTITGTTNGTAVKIYSKLHSAGSWDLMGSATVTGTDWTYDLTLTPAGTYDVLAVDGTDADGYAQQDSIEVVSASLKIQIPTTDCDFRVYDACEIPGTTYIAMHGSAYNTSASSKVGGVAIGNNTSVYVILAYDIATKSVVWVKNIASSAFLPPDLGTKTIYADVSNVYGLYKISINLYCCKISVDGATVKFPNALKANFTNGYAGLTADADNIYFTYAGDLNITAVKVAKSELSNTSPVRSSVDVTALSQYYPTHIAYDGTYLYVSGQAVSGTKRNARVVRMTTSLASLTTVDDFVPANPNTLGIVTGMICDSSRKLIARAFAVTDGATNYSNGLSIVDGTYTNADASGKLMIANGNYYMREMVNSGYGTDVNAKLRRLSTTDLSTVWAKNYSTDAVTAVMAVAYANSKLFFIGYTDGNFDGNSAGNTKRQAIIGMIDVDNGDL